jgi:hypothetical protein
VSQAQWLSLGVLAYPLCPNMILGNTTGDGRSQMLGGPWTSQQDSMHSNYHFSHSSLIEKEFSCVTGVLWEHLFNGCFVSLENRLCNYTVHFLSCLYQHSRHTYFLLSLLSLRRMMQYTGEVGAKNSPYTLSSEGFNDSSKVRQLDQSAEFALLLSSSSASVP